MGRKRTDLPSYELPKINMEFFCKRLDREGYLVQSECFRSCIYAQKGDSLIIATAKKGIMEIKLIDVPKFIEEFVSVYNDLLEMKRMGLQRNFVDVPEKPERKKKPKKNIE